MLFYSYSFKGISQRQHTALHVTLICVKLHLRGGPSFNVRRMESFFHTKRGDVDPAGNVLLLLQGEQGQVLRGQAHPSCGKMESCHGCITTAAHPQLSVAVCELLCAGSTGFPFRSPAKADIFAPPASYSSTDDSFQLRPHMERRCMSVQMCG